MPPQHTTYLNLGFKIVVRYNTSGTCSAVCHGPLGRIAVSAVRGRESRDEAVTDCLQGLGEWWWSDSAAEAMHGLMEAVTQGASLTHAARTFGVTRACYHQWRTGKTPVSGRVRAHLLRMVGVWYNPQAERWELV